MSGVKNWRVKDGEPNIRPFFVRASTDAVWGDIAVLWDDTLAQRIAKATASEIDFQNATPAVAGIMGFFWEDLKLDADGQIAQTTPSTVEPGAAVTYPIASFSRLMHRASQPLSGTTPDKGNYQAQICVFDNNIEVLLDVCNNGAATTVTQALQWNDFGLILDGTQFKVDVNVTSGDAAGLIVTEVDTSQPNFNVSAEVNNAVWVRVKPTHQQAILLPLMYA